MKLKDRISRFGAWLNGGFKMDFFRENKAAIQRHNAEIFSTIIGALTALTFSYFVFDLAPGPSQDTRGIFLLFFLIFLALFFVHVMWAGTKLKQQSLYIILISQILFVFLLFIGPINDPENLTCFIPLFFAVAFIVPIIPLFHLGSALLIDLVVYIIITLQYKAPLLAETDIVNGVVCWIIGLLLGRSIITSRLSAIDAYNRLKDQSESELSRALTRANRDPLTNVNSRSSYEALETELDEKIANGIKPEFALIVCDVNGLKQVNDTQGHGEGDRLLIRSCEVMAKVFGNEQVYRIGGDEFVIFLQGENYTNRSALMEELIRSAKVNGSCLFAIGMADFDVHNDKRVRHVFIRADSTMYENKNLYHKILPSIRSGDIRKDKLLAELSTDLDGIFYVNLDTDEVIYARMKGIYDSIPTSHLEKDKEGMNARAVSFANLVVCEEDQERYISFMHKETLLPALMENPKQSVIYKARSAGGDTMYYQTTVKLSSTERDGRWAIIDVRNVDAIVRQEEAAQKNLEHMVAERTEQLTASNEKLNRLNETMIETVGSIIEARNVSSGKHVRRVRDLTAILARQVMEDCPRYGITENDILLISSASPLHDVGKIMMPDSILLKPDTLTKEEFEIMKTHSEKGCDVLGMVPSEFDNEYLRVGAEICRYHHEKYDGKGYPNGLKGDEIPISAQIVSICDCYDALVSERPYKPAYSREKAYGMICSGECGAFSEELLTCFAKCREEFEKQYQQEETPQE